MRSLARVTNSMRVILLAREARQPSLNAQAFEMVPDIFRTLGNVTFDVDEACIEVGVRLLAEVCLLSAGQTG